MKIIHHFGGKNGFRLFAKYLYQALQSFDYRHQFANDLSNENTSLQILTLRMVYNILKRLYTNKILQKSLSLDPLTNFSVSMNEVQAIALLILLQNNRPESLGDAELVILDGIAAHISQQLKKPTL